ncbi:hypothetical protein LEN26_013248 [Aphanomyces euteiches]|nr:hypothetical protein LEN26_013248 [Aphanomyces euteiches]
MSLPPTRPNISSAVPKSALLSKLEAFLPKMEQENKSLQQAISAGQADKFNIEAEETNTEKPVIQMDFALGIVGDENSDNEDDDSDEEDKSSSREIKFKPQSSKEKPIHITPPTTQSRPLIQELN